MIRLAICFWLTLATSAGALPVPVKAAEHRGFTRLVLDYGRSVRWELGRSADGYALRVDSPKPDYDFSNSFKLIGVERVMSLETQKDTGDLIIGLSCRCYATPFEYRTGIIVIDFRNGVPPKDSIFERTLEDNISSKPTRENHSDISILNSETYNWKNEIDVSLKSEHSENTKDRFNFSELSLSPKVERLRRQITEGLASGASGNLIRLSLPTDLKLETDSYVDWKFESIDIEENKAVPDANTFAELPKAHIRENYEIKNNKSPVNWICVEADEIDVMDWRGQATIAEQLALSRDGLTTEFDRPNLTALEGSVQFYISIGFGQEVRQILQAYPGILADESKYLALSSLVDGNVDKEKFFNGQMSCSTPAAIWSVLSNDKIKKGDFVNTDSVYLAFSGFPVELRRSLGPSLIQRLLSLGDVASAKKIFDALQRISLTNNSNLQLTDAAINSALGQNTEAERQLRPVALAVGPENIDATIALIELRVSQTLPVGPEYVKKLDSVASEYAGTPVGARLDRALTLARAASGDFINAFSEINKDPKSEADLWRLLANLGSDDDLLALALLASDVSVPSAETSTKDKLNSRLSALGFPAEASRWGSDGHASNPSSEAGLSSFAGGASNEPRERNKSHGVEAMISIDSENTQQPNTFKAVPKLSEYGVIEDVQINQAMAGDWNGIAQSDAVTWKSLAASIIDEGEYSSDFLGEAKPLSYGRHLLEQANETHQGVMSVLSGIIPPESKGLQK